MSAPSPGARVLLTRHGESAWNAAGRWQGQADPPLTERGLQQAERAARAVVGEVERVVASDLSRAAETGRRIAAHLGVALTLHRDLRERDIGPWSGLSTAEVEAGWPGYLAEGKRPDGAELDEPMWERIERGLRRAAEPGGRVLVVAHGGVIALLERRLGDPRGKVRNLEARWVDVPEAGPLTLGERRRLDPEATETAVEAGWQRGTKVQPV